MLMSHARIGRYLLRAVAELHLDGVNRCYELGKLRTECIEGFRLPRVVYSQFPLGQHGAGRIELAGGGCGSREDDY